MLAADSGKGAILILLDLGLAFGEMLLNGFCSYLKDRTSVVQLGNYISDSAAYFCGVPQGSILGPIFFSLCFRLVLSVRNTMLLIIFMPTMYNFIFH